MLKALKIFERAVVVALLGMLMITVAASAVELGVVLIRDLLHQPFLRLDLHDMLEVFGFFLMVLLGLELLEIVKDYLEASKVHVEVVLLVAMVAVGRKIVILDYKTIPAGQMFGIAAVMIALAAAYYILKRTACEWPRPASRETKERP